MDLKNCKKGNHTFENILTTHEEETKTVLWCSVCGAIVVNGTSDGIIHPAKHKPLTWPQVALEAAQKPETKKDKSKVCYCKKSANRGACAHAHYDILFDLGVVRCTNNAECVHQKYDTKTKLLKRWQKTCEHG